MSLLFIAMVAILVMGPCLYKLSFSLSQNAPHDILVGQTVSEKKIFENYGNIHVYCSQVGADLSMGSIFQTHKSSVHLPISIKVFFQITL